MKLWVITLAHVDAPILESSLAAYYATADRIHHAHILLDHHWPINYWAHRKRILELGEQYDCKVMAPYENMGSHNGYNWTFGCLRIADEDYILTYDSDSMPVTKGWDSAMVKVLDTDPKFAAVSLSINADLACKNWAEEDVGGIVVKHPAEGIEMINVTMWRFSFIKQVGGIGGSNFYGYTEHAMFQPMAELGLKHGYLRDYSENPRPVEPHPVYLEWKREHVAFRFTGNFDAYCRMKGLS